jgi:hypothetical protein
MGVPASEVGYTSATTGRGNHEVHKGHVVALEKKNIAADIGLCYTLYVHGPPSEEHYKFSDVNDNDIVRKTH